MASINLHQIFRYLVRDDEILSTVINNTNIMDKQHVKKPKKNKMLLMSSIIVEYMPLAPHEIQQYTLFPPSIKKFLIPDHVRYGIKNIIERNMVNINISFLNSLNILLRPNIYNLSVDEQVKNLFVLEDFIKHRISSNYQIDKVIKNTIKVQNMHKELIKNMTEGKITPDLIQFIVNIFEINLVVFDFITHDINLYWTYGSKHPDFNTFKDIYYMAYVQGNFEPIFIKNHTAELDSIHQTYAKILTDPNIKCIKEINLSVPTLIAIDTWNISSDYFIKIIERYFPPKPFEIELDFDAI